GRSIQSPSWLFVRFSLPPASRTQRLPLANLTGKPGNRLKYQLVDSETDEVVDLADRARGYEIGKEEFLLVEDDELAALEIESKQTIDIHTFVPRRQIDLRYLDSPYYITPSEPVGQEAWAELRVAMRNKDWGAIARVVIRNGEQPIAREPLGKGLRATTLRYAYEVRKAEEYFESIQDIKVPGEMLK